MIDVIACAGYFAIVILESTGSISIALFCACDIDSVGGMAAAIVAYIRGCSDFYQSQCDMFSGDVAADSARSMAKSAKAQINALRVLSPADATSVMGSVTGSTFPADIKEDIARALQARLASVVAPVAQTTTLQHIRNPCGYPTESDWAYFSDMAKTSSQVSSRLRDRLRLCGAVKLSERSYGALAALLAAVREPDMTSLRLHALVLDLKQAIAIPLNLSFEISAYPDDPSDLPSHLFDAAYSTEQPVHRDLEHFKSCYDRCPLRGSHKSVRPSSAQTEVVPHGGQATGLSPQMFESMFMGFAQRFMNMDRSVDMANGGHGPERPDGTDASLQQLNLRLLRTEPSPAGGRTPATHPRALPPVMDHQMPPPTDEAPALVGESPAAVGDGDDMDADDAVAKLEALAVTVAKSAKMKRPAAATLKRPASAALGLAPIKAMSPMKVMAKPAPIKAMAPMKVMAKPAGAHVAKPKAAKKKLGCSRCRGSKVGCLTCRSPTFTGKRFNK